MENDEQPKKIKFKVKWTECCGHTFPVTKCKDSDGDDCISNFAFEELEGKFGYLIFEEDKSFGQELDNLDWG